MNVSELVEQPPFGVAADVKRARLLEALNMLTQHHYDRCQPYRSIAQSAEFILSAQELSEVPYIPVGLFKDHDLVSVAREDIIKVLTSSGTTGQIPSRIYLDRQTASLQSKALVRILGEVLGPRRLPMLVIDHKGVTGTASTSSARGAGVLGLMNYGRQPLFVLGEDMSLDLDAVKAFLAEHGREPFLMFGFTFMVWAYFFEQVKDLGLDLSHGVLIHSGGWKKLRELEVSNAIFKTRLRSSTGLERVHNFYGMVEQVGSVFMEGTDGYLHAPAFAEVIIRDPVTWKPLPAGEPGVVQVLSCLPLSYPGHSILTEDLGVTSAGNESADQANWEGTRFEVLGRAPKTEVRGCSDTHQGTRPAESLLA